MSQQNQSVALTGIKKAKFLAIKENNVYIFIFNNSCATAPLRFQSILDLYLFRSHL